MIDQSITPGLRQPAAQGSAVPLLDRWPAQVAALLLALAMASPAAAQEAQKQKLEELQREIGGARDRQRALEEDAAAAARERKLLQDRAVEAAARAQAAEQTATDLELRRDALQAEAAAKRASLEQRRVELAGTLDTIARLSRRPPEAMLAGPQEALESFRSARLLGAIVPELMRRGEALRTELAGLASVQESLAAEEARLMRSLAELAGERQALEQVMAEKARAEIRSSDAAREEGRRLARLGSEARDLKGLIDRLAEEERQRQREERRRAEEQRAEERRAAEAEARAQAEAQRRRMAALPASPAVPPIPRDELLDRPVRGRVVGRFGEPGQNGLINKGIALQTRSEAQVVAPAGGRVVFAGPFRGYGQLLIISHSEGYHTLMTGFTRIDALLGQDLVIGEPVGQMGTEEDGRKPQLYVELRLRGEPVNPLPWLTANERKVSG